MHGMNVKTQFEVRFMLYTVYSDLISSEHAVFVSLYQHSENRELCDIPEGEMNSLLCKMFTKS